MNNRLSCLGQATNEVFRDVPRLIAILVLICIISIANFSNAFADNHETEAETEASKPAASGWFQVDVDTLGTYFLVSATHPLGGASIVSTVYINDKFGEFDIGVPLPVITGERLTLILQPMVGVGFDYATVNGPNSLHPQIFAFLPAGKIFGFHWTISKISTLFDSESLNELYNRTYLTYALNDTVAVGPQFESVLGLGDGGGLWALNFGGRLNISYGKNNTLGIYVGYETKKDEGETGLTGRLNFTRRW